MSDVQRYALLRRIDNADAKQRILEARAGGKLPADERRRVREALAQVKRERDRLQELFWQAEAEHNRRATAEGGAR